MNRTRVLVVDDSVFSRQAIKKMLEVDPGIEVIGLASSGLDAMKKTLRMKPDLITLDFEMPEMDGFSFLRWLMQHIPTPVIMVSSYSDTKTVFKALDLGAVDFIAKPSKRASAEIQNIEKDLIAKVKGIRGLDMKVLNRNLQLLKHPESLLAASVKERDMMDLVAIGSSTGGPSALQVILKELPGDFPAGIVISQHMPRGFTRSLAERLDDLCMVGVKEAEDGDEVQRGKVFICPGGQHLILKKRGRKVKVALKRASFDDRYAPSVDAMMLSAAEQFGDAAIGVLLTGMGNDGKDGMLKIKSSGGYTIAESKETAVVFGMPAAAIKAGAASMVLPLQGIASELIRVAGNKEDAR